MRSSVLMHSAVAGAALACLLAAPAQAEPIDKRTYFTFSGPISMPGVTLPAGTYQFRLPSQTDRSVVQVLSNDGTKTYGLFMTLPIERPDPAEGPEVRFMESAEGMAAPVKTWWYPGERRGFEFIYPKDQTRRLMATAAPAPAIQAASAASNTD